MYGTSVKSVEDVKRGGKMCILDIDTQVRPPLPAALSTFGELMFPSLATQPASYDDRASSHDTRRRLV